MRRGGWRKPRTLAADVGGDTGPVRCLSAWGGWQVVANDYREVDAERVLEVVPWTTGLWLVASQTATWFSNSKSSWRMNLAVTVDSLISCFIIASAMCLLQSAGDALEGAGLNVTSQLVDVSSRESVSSLAQAAKGLGSVTQVAHTAGQSPTMAPPEAILTVDAAIRPPQQGSIRRQCT